MDIGRGATVNVQGGGLCITSARDVLPARFLADLPAEGVHGASGARVRGGQIAIGHDELPRRSEVKGQRLALIINH